MPQATLSFKLPEEDSEFSQATNGWKWRMIVSEILENIRKDVKYSVEITDDQKKVLQNIRAFIFERMGEENLSLDK